ncbi:hypothetical protein SUGI_1063510 [Cryptomeria japonica]|nr:hypothetical protein SUGI_1063510 [Cryptomeria japonica]
MGSTDPFTVDFMLGNHTSFPRHSLMMNGSCSKQGGSTSTLDSSKESVQEHVHTGAQRLNTESHACSSARSAASSVDVFLQEPMATKRSAPATTIGKPKKENPSVPS